MAEAKPDELDAAILELRRQRRVPARAERPARRAPVVPISAEIAKVGEQTAEAYAQLKAEVEAAIAAGRMVVEIDPALIVDSAWRDRADGAFADEAFLSLCQSLREHGQLNPVGLRRAAAPDGVERYEIVFGHRRVRAARALGVKVKAVLLGTDDRTLIARMLVENALRTDLSPWEKAQHYRRLLGEGMFSRAELARLVAVSPQEISNVLALAELPAEVAALLGDPRQLGINAGQRLLAALRGHDQVPAEIAERVQALPTDPKLRAARLTAWLAAATTPDGGGSVVIRDRHGRRYGRLSRSGRQVLIRFQPDLDEEVLERLARRIPELYEQLAAEKAEPPAVSPARRARR
jgi:ParB family chromosome partitioning protein